MVNIFPLQSTPRSTAEYRVVMEQMLLELDQSINRMEVDRKDIERLKIESDALKEETRAILSTMGVEF